jgi:hypothetical protein
LREAGANRLLARVEVDPHFDATCARSDERQGGAVKGCRQCSETSTSPPGTQMIQGVGSSRRRPTRRFECAAKGLQKPCATAEAQPAAASVAIPDELGIVRSPRSYRRRRSNSRQSLSHIQKGLVECRKFSKTPFASDGA